MTLQTLPHPIALPQSPKGMASNGTTAFGAIGTIDNVGEKIAQMVLLPKAGNISVVHFRTGTVANGDDVVVSLETVDGATGDPTGTLWDTDTSATVTVDSGDDDTWMVATLTAAATIAASDVGKPIAIVVTAPGGYSGTMEIDGAFSSFFRSGRSDYDGSFWARRDTGSGWIDDGYIFSEAAAVRLGYDDGSFGFLQTSYAGDENPSNVSFDQGTTPDEIGIKLQFPFAFQACGIWLGSMLLREDSAFKVYNDSDVEQMTLPAWPRNWVARPDNYKGIIYIYGDTFTVAANTWYRITCQPSTTDGSNNIAYYVPQVNNAHWAQWGLNQDSYKWTERTNAGAWTDRNDRLLFGGFMADQFHDGAGVGGSGSSKLVNGGLVG